MLLSQVFDIRNVWHLNVFVFGGSLGIMQPNCNGRGGVVFLSCTMYTNSMADFRSDQEN